MMKGKALMKDKIYRPRMKEVFVPMDPYFTIQETR